MLRGREEDLRAVAAALGDCGAVVVSGEPGIGKTALLEAVSAGGDTGVHRGVGFATLQWHPMRPLSIAIGRQLEHADDVTAATVVRRHIGGGLLLIDDAQWADEASRRVIALLVGQTRVLVAVRSPDPVGEHVTRTLAAAGAAAHRLERLSDPHALALVRSTKPDLGPKAVKDIVRRAGGNPLLLEELARSDRPSATLRLAVAARLRALSDGARASLGLLAVVGRPVPSGCIGDTAAELVDAHLVTVREDVVAVCHPLLAEIWAEQLGDAGRRAAHLRAASLPLSLGERARHLADAGEVEPAYRLAVAAAEEAGSAGERGRHLALAARWAPRQDAQPLLTRAVTSLLAAGEDEAAHGLLSGATTPADAAERFRLHLLRAQTAWAVGDGQASADATTEAELVLAEDPPEGLDPTEARIAVQLSAARYALLAGGEPVRALELARQAAMSARARNSPLLARAEYLLGSSEGMAGQPGYEEHLGDAMQLARAAGDHDLELRAGNNLIATYEMTGHHDAGRGLALDLAARATDLELGAHVTQFQAMAANLDVLDGHCHAALTTCDDLLNGILQPRTRDQVEVTRTIALLDLGRFEEAGAQIAQASQTAAKDVWGFAQFRYLAAEMELMLGRPESCLTRLTELRSGLSAPTELEAFARLTQARARAALGRAEPADDHARAWPPLPFFRAAPVEVHAISLMLAAEPLSAAQRFEEAAALWEPHYLRSRLYCEWQAGAARLAAGDTAGAVRQLEATERVAEARALAWQLAMVRATLRRAGERRTVERAVTPQGLTAREDQVQRLAATGLSNSEIGARLGLARRTVETQLASARAKLGARSRLVASARIDAR